MALHLLFGDKQLTECLLLLSTEDTLIVMTPLLAKALKAARALRTMKPANLTAKAVKAAPAMQAM